MDLQKQAIYMPFLGGKYTTNPGLKPLYKGETPYDQRVFQLDAHLPDFMANVEACRRENIHKYYHEYKLKPAFIQAINQFIITELCQDYPELFQLESPLELHCKYTQEQLKFDEKGALLGDSRYLSLFDALCSQVPEDIAIVQFEDGVDFLAATHVCAPSHWAPGEKIGKNFDSLHEPVPGMEKLRKNYEAMLRSIVTRGAFTRFGWSVATDTVLNQHPKEVNSSGNHLSESLDAKDPGLFVRVERQNLIGFPEHEGFIFTVRIYFYAIDTFSEVERQGLRDALQGMSPEAAAYKGLTDKMAFLLHWL